MSRHAIPCPSPILGGIGGYLRIIRRALSGMYASLKHASAWALPRLTGGAAAVMARPVIPWNGVPAPEGVELEEGDGESDSTHDVSPARSRPYVPPLCGRCLLHIQRLAGSFHTVGVPRSGPACLQAPSLHLPHALSQ